MYSSCEIHILDHLAQIIELLNDFPKPFALSGKYSRDFFTQQGRLRHIGKLKYWNLYDVLRSKYDFNPTDAGEISDFLLEMLKVVPRERASAQTMLGHPWLKDVEL
jgi:serine/threonine protein kinase